MNKYEVADDVRQIAEKLVENLPEYFSHIDLNRVFFIRTKGSRSSAIARIHGLPSIWRYVLKLDPIYIVEVISERYDGLSDEEKVKTVIHELLHIPKKFSGGLRAHGRYVNKYIVEKLYKLYDMRRDLWRDY